MKEILHIDLWWFAKKDWDNSRGGPKEGKHSTLLEIDPISQDLREIKVQLANELRRLKRKILYYYVVVAVIQSNGDIGYRTIIPKTFIVPDKV